MTSKLDLGTFEAIASAAPTTRRRPAPGPVPTARPRRLRRTPALRALVRETRLDPAMLVAPLFVRPGAGIREPIASLPGVDRLSPDEAAAEAQRLASLGVGGIILFGLPSEKDPIGTGAWFEDGIVQETTRRIRALDLPTVVIADTCLCSNESRPLRAAPRRRLGRQRRGHRAPRRDRGEPGPGRGGHRRSQRDDGWPGRGDPACA
jgi:hypothetical protein